MGSAELENLLRIGKLKAEKGTQEEIDGLIHAGESRLADARNESLSIESRFDLAYNAAHALALAALRWRGFRPGNRYVVFQALPHTVGLGAGVWRVLAKCHERRNSMEYEGHLEVDEQLLGDLLTAAAALAEAVVALGPLPTDT